MRGSLSGTTQSLPSRDLSLASAGSHQEVSSYQYQPLPHQGRKGHIRRLILEQGSNDDPLVGTLETIELKDAAERCPFEAISYAWAPENKDEIMIDGRLLVINAGLGEVLRQARKLEGPRALWADQICIYQDDDEEKGYQVARMGEVYKASGCTLICLGLGLEEDQQYAAGAAELIADVNAMMDREFEKSSWEWDSFPYPEPDDPLLVVERWEPWNRLIDCGWFSRGWVWQEAALGPDVRILWAGVDISWIMLLRAYCWMVRRGLLPDVADIGDVLYQRYLLTHREEAMTFYKENEADKLDAVSTLNVLDRARGATLTNPKDRIYAFLALPTSDDAISDLGLQPDYSETASHLEVYKDFAIRYLATTRDLNLLCYVEHDDEQSISDPQLPSWVPRWDRGADATTWFENEGERQDPNYTISDVTDDGSVLRVRGIVLDSVEYVLGDQIQERHPDPSDQIRQLWRKFRPQSAKCPHQSILSLAFLVASCRGKYRGEWERWLQALVSFAQLLDSDQSMGSDITESEEVQRISRFAAFVSDERRLILLSRGYYGVASRVTREGDVCAIIYGVTLPLILRKVVGSEDRYRVVGPAYVQSKECDDYGVPNALGHREADCCEDWLEWDPPPAVQDILLC